MLDVIGDFVDFEISEAERLAIEAEENLLEMISAHEWAECDADMVSQ